MIADSLLRLPRPAKVGSFAALMSLYESNFVRLGWLFPKQTQPRDAMISTPRDDLPLYLDVLEDSRYTTTLRLTYLFQDPDGVVADPDLRVRLYHDARLAEAMACTDHHRHAALRQLDPGPGAELSRRWTRNVMLNKWLEYCSDKGHRFVVRESDPVQASIS